MTDEVVAGYRRALCRGPPGAGRGIPPRDRLRALDVAPNRQPARLRRQFTGNSKRRGKQRTARYGRRYAQPRPKGWATSELMRITGWKRTKLYRHLREYAEAGRAIQVSRGRWRARATDEPSP